MEIWEKYEDLIIQYQISDIIPEYEKFILAKRLFASFYEQLRAKTGKVILIASNLTDILWFSRQFDIPESLFLLINDDASDQLEISRDVTYLVISYLYQYDISDRLIKEGADPICLYDMFRNKGFYFTGNFFDIFHTNMIEFKTKEVSWDYKDFDINRIYFEHRRMYEHSKDKAIKLLYLKYMIFDCAFVCDFVTLKKCVELISSNDNIKTDRYTSFYKAVQQLLDEVEIKLSNRQSKDVMMYWLDALEYGEDQSVEFLKSLDDTSLVCDNMYTVTPFTSTTYRTLMTGKTVVDDQNYKIEKIGEHNSNFIKMLKENGYQYRYYGNLQIPEQNVCSRNLYSVYTPISMLIWDAVMDILESEKPLFCMLHEVLQTHNPFISFDLEGEEYVGCEEHPGVQTESEKLIAQKQIMPSRKYVDKQLKFWNEILPGQMFKIYMSDHGHTTFGRFHPMFKVQQSNLKPLHINNLLSYVSFSWIIESILKEDIDQLVKSECQSVIVQDIPFYNKDVVKMILDNIEEFEATYWSGYQGIITKEDIFIKYNDGAELYVGNRKNKKKFSQEHISKLRKLLHTNCTDVYKESKFKDSRLIFNAIKHRNVDLMDKRIRIILDLFRSFGNQRIALRGGGIHTIRLLMILPDEVIENICCIIDKDKECYAGTLGFPIWTMDELSKDKIDKVVISSFDFDQIWKKELSNYLDKAQVVSIYDYLETQGVICQKEFYRYHYQKEDFYD